MELTKEEFKKYASQMGIARWRDTEKYFKENPKETYDDFQDIVNLSRFVESNNRRWKTKGTGFVENKVKGEEKMKIYGYNSKTKEERVFDSIPSAARFIGCNVDYLMKICDKEKEMENGWSFSSKEKINSNKLYPVSDFSGYFVNKDGNFFYEKEDGEKKELTIFTGGRGCCFVNMRKEGKVYKKSVGRIMAEVFLGNPPKPNMVVRHVDGNQENNSISNLEYITRNDLVKNSNYHNKRSFEKHKVYALNMETNEVKIFESIKEASRELNYSDCYIRMILDNPKTTSNGWMLETYNGEIKKEKEKGEEKDMDKLTEAKELIAKMQEKELAKPKPKFDIEKICKLMIAGFSKTPKEIDPEVLNGWSNGYATCMNIVINAFEEING